MFGSEACTRKRSRSEICPNSKTVFISELWSICDSSSSRGSMGLALVVLMLEQFWLFMGIGNYFETAAFSSRTIIAIDTEQLVSARRRYRPF